jgi:hypothetical protein
MTWIYPAHERSAKTSLFIQMTDNALIQARQPPARSAVSSGTIG